MVDYGFNILMSTETLIEILNGAPGECEVLGGKLTCLKENVPVITIDYVSQPPAIFSTKGGLKYECIKENEAWIISSITSVFFDSMPPAGTNLYWANEIYCLGCCKENELENFCRHCHCNDKDEETLDIQFVNKTLP